LIFSNSNGTPFEIKSPTPERGKSKSIDSDSIGIIDFHKSKSPLQIFRDTGKKLKYTRSKSKDETENLSLSKKSFLCTSTESLSNYGIRRLKTRTKSLADLVVEKEEIQRESSPIKHRKMKRLLSFGKSLSPVATARPKKESKKGLRKQPKLGLLNAEVKFSKTPKPKLVKRRNSTSNSTSSSSKEQHRSSPNLEEEIDKIYVHFSSQIPEKMISRRNISLVESLNDSGRTQSGEKSEIFSDDLCFDLLSEQFEKVIEMSGSESDSSRKQVDSALSDF